MTYNPLWKRLPFWRSVYVKKVMKLLAFIFEQPSYDTPVTEKDEGGAELHGSDQVR